MSQSLSSVTNALQTWYANLADSFSALTLKDYIRLVWIIGGYLFLRPYLDRGFRKLMESGASAAERAKPEAAAVDKSKMSGNGRGLAADSEEDEDGGAKNAVPQWGKAARKRQRKFLKRVEQEAERKREEEEDRDIADLLED